MCDTAVNPDRPPQPFRRLPDRPSSGAEVLARIPADRLVDLLDIAEDGIVTVDATHAIVLFNRGAAKLFGYDPGEILGRPLDVLIPPRFRAAHAGQIAEFGRAPEPARLMGERREVFGLRKDGTEFPAEVSISKFGAGGELLLTAIVRDVSERKRYEAATRELGDLRTRDRLADAEAAARHSETLFRRIVETAHEGIWQLDADARVVFVNDRMAGLLGYRPDEVRGRQKWDFLFDEDRAAGRALFDRRRAGVSEQADVRFRHRDGRAVWTLMSARPMTGEDGTFRGALDMFTDVTERRQAEAALLASESRLRLFVDHAPAALAMFDRDMRYLAVSRRWVTDYHLGDAELIGRLYYDIFPGVPEQWKEAHRRALAGEVVRADQDAFERNGNTQWLRWEARPWHDPAGIGGVILFAEDITEVKRAEHSLRSRTEELRATTQQLWQAAKLAGVGELAASIAHELNNPLGTVSLRVERLLAKTPEGDPRRRPLEVIEQEVERMAGLVGNLLQFSRAGRDQVSTVDVPEEVLKTVELVGHHLRKRQIRVEPEFAPGVPHIHADRQQLRQVFLNLFTNAADAMPGGGRLAPRVRTGVLAPARPAVVVEVADTGTGIPPELLARVCEPFFTTKDEGKGTGLGLAICRRIVQQHHGTLEVESRPGRGTTIRITLPIRPDTNVAGLHAE